MRKTPLLTGYTLSFEELRTRRLREESRERSTRYSEIADSIVVRDLGFGRLGTIAVARILVAGVDGARLNYGEGSEQYVRAQEALDSARGGRVEGEFNKIVERE